MIRRLLLGLVIGLLVGGLLAAALVAGPLKVLVFEGTAGVLLAYLSAALAGVLTGLFAGRPIWASGAKIEAGLKAFFGALLAVGGMFALRQWAAGWSPDLNAWGLGLGHAPVGELPAASLPLIAAALGGLFEIDNTGDDASAARPQKAGTAAPSAKGNNKKRVVAGAASQEPRGRAAVEVEDAEADAAPRRARR